MTCIHLIKIMISLFGYCNKTYTINLFEYFYIFNVLEKKFKFGKKIKVTNIDNGVKNNTITNLYVFTRKTL